MSETLNISPIDNEFWKIVDEIALPIETDEDYMPGQEMLPLEMPSEETK